MITRLYLDTNVVLDLLGEREPYLEAIEQIAGLADKGKLEMIASVLSLSTVYYVLSKYFTKNEVTEKLQRFGVLCLTADVTKAMYEKALFSDFTDVEDAIQYFCALENDCHCIITRNGKDFKKSGLPVFTPDEYLALLKS